MAQRSGRFTSNSKRGTGGGASSFAFGEGQSLERTIGSLVQPQPNGCWLFKGKRDTYGVHYSTINGVQQDILVHRFVYETMVGDIPDGYVVHHECETPGCCNPTHLAAMSPGDHSRRHAEMRAAC